MIVHIPLSSGCTSIMVTDAIPYVESGQLKGILAGMPGAAEYEKLVYDYMVDEQLSNSKYIFVCPFLDSTLTPSVNSQTHGCYSFK